MTAPLDAAALDAIEARAAAATAGPWWVQPEEASDTAYTPARVFACTSADYWSGDADEMVMAQGGPDDADFIAAARSDVPVLVAEVRRLSEAVARVREVASAYSDADITGHADAVAAHVGRAILAALRAAPTGVTE